MPSAIDKLKDKEWLVGQYVDSRRSAEDIANEVGCDKSAVCRALKRHGVEARKRTSKYAILSEGDWLRKKYIDEQMSIKDIAKLSGSTPGNVREHLIQKGIEVRTSAEGLSIKYPDGRFGEDASNWRGGRRFTGEKGYVHIFYPEHPNATKAGYMMEHRLVMEKQLGRYLEADEDVHHINENVKDNRPENLMVVSRSEHKIIHSLLRKSKMKDVLQKKTKTQAEKLEELRTRVQEQDEYILKLEARKQELEDLMGIKASGS